MQIVVGNVLANYEISGPSTSLPIVILHGWGHNLSIWKAVTLPLSQRHRVVTVDLPGFGSTTPLPHAASIEDYAVFVKSLLRKLGIGKHILIGHSLGGKIAIILASKKNNIYKLFLISPSGLEKRSLYTALKIALFKTLKRVIFFAPERIKKSIFNLFASPDYRSAGQLKETFKKIVNQKVENYCKKIQTPTIIIWGENDKEVKPQCAKTLHALIPNSTLRILWAAGHSPHLEKPEKLTALIEEYL